MVDESMKPLTAFEYGVLLGAVLFAMLCLLEYYVTHKRKKRKR